MPRVGAYVLTATLLATSLVSCATTARVSDVYMSLDADGSRRRSIFFTDTKEIHCIVEMGIGRKGVTIEAVIHQLQRYDFPSDKFFEFDGYSANAESSPQPQEGIQKLDVSLKPEGPNGEDASGSPFPPGRYQCEARLDGELQQTSIFNIDFPPCPTSEVRTGQLCFGFYKNNQACGRYGLLSHDPAVCVCTLKGWDCGK
jgi:hypothetical protein